MSTAKTITDALDARRRELGLSYADLAYMTGVTKTAVYQTLRVTSSPTLGTLLRYADALGVDINMELVPREQGLE